MPCAECPHCIRAERNARRCRATVPASTYSKEHQCEKPGNKRTGYCTTHERAVGGNIDTRPLVGGGRRGR